MSDADWPTFAANIRENFRAVVQGDAGVISQLWVTSSTANVVFETATQTAKARLIGYGFSSSEFLAVATNAALSSGTWNRDDVSRVAWMMQFEPSSDTISWYRAAAAANPISWSQLMQLSSVGALSLAGGIKERGRSTALGDSIPVAFAAGNFTAPTGTWTVASGDQTTFAYAYAGGEARFQVTITPGTSTLSATPAYLQIAVPFTAKYTGIIGSAWINQGASGYSGFAYMAANTSTLLIYKSDSSAFASGTVLVRVTGGVLTT